jgi:hypothetical protein
MAPGGAKANVPLPMPDTEALVHAQREYVSAGGGGTPPILTLAWSGRTLHFWITGEGIVHRPSSLS